MNKILKWIIIALSVIFMVSLAALAFHAYDAGVFNPQGTIATQERNLIILAVLIMLCVAVPMLIALYMIAWRYRAGNDGVKHEPNHVGSPLKQLLWWTIPAVVIVVIGTINWKSTHALYPDVPLASNVPPITIQVVALDWKWLFIYPAQGIATVNYVEFPAGTPVHFELTADAPMNSFWIPQLGSQEYAMAGMVNQLNLEADAPGEYTGKASEIDGEGYSGMTFAVKSTSQVDFDAWVASVRQMANPLDDVAYNQLAAPSTDNPPAYYSSVDSSLYGAIIMKYMSPQAVSSGASDEMPGVPVDAASQTMPDMQNATMSPMMPGMQM